MGITILHFISDGPTTQYKNKTNFRLPFAMGFEVLHWKFLEASHGKGPGDGIEPPLKTRLIVKCFLEEMYWVSNI